MLHAPDSMATELASQKSPWGIRHWSYAFFARRRIDPSGKGLIFRQPKDSATTGKHC
jgi:hypothetical protein